MQCPQCHSRNPEEMSFCVECGTRLSVRCEQCGAEMMAKYKFCGQCGSRMQAPGARAPTGQPAPPTSSPTNAPSTAGDLESHRSHPAPTGPASTLPAPGSDEEREAAGAGPEAGQSRGERKQVTVMFCELSTDDDGAEAISPDLLHGVLDRFQSLARDAVRRYGGVVYQSMGEQMVAIFGAPIAYEDHSRRAVLAGLDLRRTVSDSQQALANDDRTRWQIRLGLDTGALVVGGVGGTIVGAAMVTARQIHDQSEPGQLLISEAVARAVRSHVEVREVAEEQPGRPRALEVLRRDPAALGGMIGSRAVGPFVGRRHELAVLEELRFQANNGLGQVVGLAGDAGTGKSRLLHEFYRRTFPGQQVSYLRGQCLSYGSGVPYLPIIDMIRKASRITDGDDGPTIAAKLAESLGQVSSAVENTLPYLLRLLGTEHGTEVIDDLEPQAIQAGIFECMRRLVFDACRRALVVVEIEDLHWIDTTSAEFLESLIEMMATSRLLVLLTYRAGYQPRWLEKSYATQITLRRLSVPESSELFDSLSAGAELEVEQKNALIAKADGNPFFLEEMVRSMRSGAAVATVPDTIQGILMARIDRMPDAHKQIMRTAAVLGRRFSVDLLRQLWDGAESPDELLEDLQRWELVYLSLEEARPTYVFKHALTQEVAYQTLLSERRKELHARAAKTLEEQYEDRIEEALDRLVYHYPAAGEAEKTVHYLTLFAERAAGDYAHAEAVKALLEALRHADGLPMEVRDRRKVALLIQVAESLLPLARFGETLELLEEHRGIVDGLEDPALSAPYFFWLGHTHTYLGHQGEAVEHSERAIELARESGDQATEGKACYVLGRDGFWSGNFEAGVDNSQRAIVLLERADEPWWQGQSYWVAGFNLYAQSRFEEAITALERAFAIGEALDDYRLDPSWSLGYFYASLGEATLGIEQCRMAMERSRDPLNSAVSEGFLGYALLRSGDDLEGAMRHLEAGVASMREAGMQQILAWFLAFLAEALRSQGNLMDAAKTAKEGLAVAEEADFAYGAELARQSLARTSFARGDLESARAHLESTLAAFEAMKVPFEVARTTLYLSEVAAAEGRMGDALELAQSAHERFRAQKVPFWIERAEAQVAICSAADVVEP